MVQILNNNTPGDQVLVLRFTSFDLHLSVDLPRAAFEAIPSDAIRLVC